MTTPAAGVSVQRAGSLEPAAPAANVCFTIGTLVNDHAQYAAMRASFEAGGFSGDCEFLYIDNTQSHQTGAYAGLNAILDAARAPLVILCHQDVRLLDDQRQHLDSRLAELQAQDPSWAVAGNAGGVSPGRLVLRITDPHGPDQSRGSFPSRVTSLDENFLIVRRASRIGFSHDLDGFHLYGADLCLHAAQMGCSCYVIDFHLEHLSPGHKSAAFFAAEQAFVRRWSRALRPRWLQTTCTLMRITANPVRSRAGRGIDRLAAKITRRIAALEGKPQAARDMT
jgi:hypothetical protein